MRVAIVDCLGSPYDGSTPFKRGLGGSESAVVYIARELVKLGIKVNVYNDCEGMDAKPGSYDGVNYRPISHITANSTGYDVIIASRSVRPFTEYGWMGDRKKQLRVLWMHDTFCDGDDQVESLAVNGTIDEIWTLSDWHTSYISQCVHGHRRMMEVLKRKIWVTRNGVNVWRDVEIKEKTYSNFIFNAAVSKGMETLLEDIWPRVKERIPKANLTVIGGAYPLKNADVQNDKLTELQKKHGGKNDVIFTGIIDQKSVANHLANAGWMIYPQSFPETFGISTVESLAYGTPVISGRFGAMEETAIEDGCYLMDYPVDSNVLYTFDKESHIKHFVDMVVNAYNNHYLWMQKANAAVKVREVCGWDKVALQWRQHLFKKTGRYLTKEQYHEVQRINHRTHEIFNKRWSNPEEWAYYPEKEKKLHVVVPFYNADQYLSKCVESIKAQNYENYDVHFINDDSTDGSACILSFATDGWDNFHCHSNDKNVGALANQLMCINEIIDGGEDDIIVLIDGDDALINDPNVFKKINQLYHDGAEMTYGSMWSMVDNIPLVAQEYPADVFEKKSFRDYRFPWNFPYSHLRTFTLDLFNRCSDSDFRDSNGDYFKAGGDGALFYALLENARPGSVRAVKDILYLYNDLNPANDYKINGDEQTRNANSILNGPIKRNVVEIKKDDFIKFPKRILIAIPTAQNIHAQTFKSIYDLDIPEGYDVDFQYFYGYNVDQVRNLIADWTVKGYDYLFAIDYDISFSRDTLTKLLRHDVPLVSGLYIQRKPNTHILELYRSNSDGSQYNVPIGNLKKNALEEIDGCGFGCVLIRKEVFEAVGYPYFVYHDALTMEQTISEDVDFCNKVKAKGFKMYADTGVLCKHHGMTAYEVEEYGLL